MDNQRYSQRGVSAEKEDIHNAIKNLDKGLYPNAFCKIIPDILGHDPLYCNIMHADGAGTKSSTSRIIMLKISNGAQLRRIMNTLEEQGLLHVNRT